MGKGLQMSLFFQERSCAAEKHIVWSADWKVQKERSVFVRLPGDRAPSLKEGQENTHLGHLLSCPVAPLPAHTHNG